MTLPQIASQEDWLAASKRLLVKEKEAFGGESVRGLR
jgi:predicted dithiol-disulfide oxidoreductase (DUF899 family)